MLRLAATPIVAEQRGTLNRSLCPLHRSPSFGAPLPNLRNCLLGSPRNPLRRAGQYCHAVAVKAALEAILGPVEHLEVVKRGYTHIERVVATLGDGRSVFAKRAVDETTATWLRQEHMMYEALRNEAFVPKVVGWADSDLPILLLEDLSDAIWPPPWDSAQIGAVLSALDELARCRAPEGLPRLPDGEQPGEGWHRVLTDPSEFLSVGLCDADWLDHAGPVLRAAAAAATLTGESVVHCDIRSDNICFRLGSALLVDWNLARIGNPEFDVAFWLPSLAAENGPLPEDVAPRCTAELAAYVAGFFACRAGQAEIPVAPLVRQAQRQQLRTALPWAARALDLPPPAALV